MAKKLKSTIAGFAIHPYIAQLTNTYDAKDKPKSSLTLRDQEFASRLLVTKDAWRELKKNYPKMTMSAPKEYSASDFKKAFKVDPPKKYETSDGEYLVIGFTAYSHYKGKDGKEDTPKAPPRLVGVKKVNVDAGIYKDAEGNEFDQEVLLSTGTEGVLQFKARPVKDKIKLDLYAFQIQKLVEFIPEDSLDFDIEDEDEEDDDLAFDADEESSESSSESAEEEDDDWDE